MASPPFPTGRLRVQTKQAAIRASLRESILSLAIPPGAPLVVDSLARSLGASSIPVREALLSLEGEGLVTLRPHIGFAAAPVSTDEVGEVFALLEALETAAVPAALARRTPADAAEARAALRGLDAARVDAESWAAANRRLHTALAQPCGFPLLLRQLALAFDRWERLRRWFFRDQPFTRPPARGAHDHGALVRLAERGDAPGLEAALRAHNRAAAALTLRSLASRPAAAPTP